MHVFGCEAPENAIEGTVLENLSDFSAKFFLRNAMKVKIKIYGVKVFVPCPEKLFLKSAKLSILGLFHGAEDATKLFDPFNTRYFGIISASGGIELQCSGLRRGLELQGDQLKVV